MTDEARDKTNADEETSVDFSQLILGFSSAALHYMGEAPIEGQDPGSKNLPLAKQNIDIICMLRDKTAGNLSGDERELVEQLLSDLRLKYVASTGGSGT